MKRSSLLIIDGIINLALGALLILHGLVYDFPSGSIESKANGYEA